MIRHRCKNKSLNSCQYISVNKEKDGRNGDDKNIHKIARFFTAFEYFFLLNHKVIVF